MAHHKPQSKTRWSASQKAEIMRLNTQGLDELQTAAGKRFDAIVKALPEPLPADAAILDIGCGAICTGKFFESSNTTYLDPLLDDFKRTYPGELPKGEFISGSAEEIDKPNASYDLILCLNTLSYVLNPELVLHEAGRLLKKDGTFVISITLWPELFARFHYLSTHLFSIGEVQNRLYCYSLRGIKNTLLRHFDIVSVQQLDIKTAMFAQEWMFVCKPKRHPDRHGS